jgi:hypothetical protein
MIVIYLDHEVMKRIMHAHDTHTTRNLEIIVIVKIKYFPYLGKISPIGVIKTCRNIYRIKMLALYSPS